MSASLWNLTGGRPMTRTRHHSEFIDKVSGLAVYQWVDRLGRYWLANGAWSLFRVETRQ